MDNQMKIKTFS